MRHAKSCWDDPDISDFDRPLNKRGKRDLDRMSSEILKQQIVPDVIFSSPSVRTKITATKMSETLDVPLHFNKDLYHILDDELLGEIRLLDNSLNTVMFVIHNPGITDIRNHFLEDYLENVPTCGCVALSFEEANDWSELSEATELFFEYPKLYFSKK